MCVWKRNRLTCNLVYTRLWKHWITSLPAEKSSFKSPNEKWRRGQQLRDEGWWWRRRSRESTGRAQTSQRSEDGGMTRSRVQGGNQRGWMDETMNCKSVYVKMWTLARRNFTHPQTHTCIWIRFSSISFDMAQHNLLPHEWTIMINNKNYFCILHITWFAFN